MRSDPVLLERTNPRGTAAARHLAAAHSRPCRRVSRGVIVEAYQQLIAEGYLTSRAGGYTRVAIAPEPPAGAPSPLPAMGARIDFCPCKADGSRFPRAAWLRSLRRVLTDVSDAEFGYVSGRGVPALHQALATYLNRVRGTSAGPEHVVIRNGYAQGIGLLIQTPSTATTGLPSGPCRVSRRTWSPTPGPRARRSPPGYDWAGSSCRPASSTPSPTPRSSPIAARPSSISSPSPYRISSEGRPGLIFGYATLDERALEQGIEILAEAMSDVRSR